jgi:hypothetical protein
VRIASPVDVISTNPADVTRNLIADVSEVPYSEKGYVVPDGVYAAIALPSPAEYETSIAAFLSRIRMYEFEPGCRSNTLAVCVLKILLYTVKRFPTWAKVLVALVVLALREKKFVVVADVVVLSPAVKAVK